MALPTDPTHAHVVSPGSSDITSAERIAGAFLASYHKPTWEQYRFTMRSWFAHCAEFHLEPIQGVRRHDIELWAKSDTTFLYDRHRARIDGHATYRVTPYLLAW